MDRELLQTYARASSRRPAARPARCRRACGSASTTRRAQAAAEFQDIFGKENFFAEIMDHGLDIERARHERPAEARARISTSRSSPPTTCTTRTQHDADSHAALLCVQSGSTLDDPKRFKFDGDGTTSSRRPRCAQLFRDHPEACDNTLLIAERCDVEFNTRRQLHAALPGAGRRDRGVLVHQGGRERACRTAYPAGIPDDVRTQAEYETGVITQMGFPGYFLVVADFINWAKRNGIRVGPGRGSGAGSMAAYAMGITDLDPLQHGLIFERFLNPDRVSMPDFDVDFDDRRRGEVIQYVTEKYGDERVAQIVTYGTIKAKQALKDAGRVLGFPFSMGERLTKAMPPRRDGQGHAARGHVRQGAPALQRGERVPRADRDRRRGQDGLRHRGRPREPQAPVGRARRRRDHVQRAADRHHPDHAARAGRPDRHAVRLPGVRGPRPDQDGLPRAAQPHDHRRRPRQHRGRTAASTSCSKTSPSTTAAAYELLAARRHAGRLPARRRPDAVAAAADEARQLRRHLGRHRAVPPGSDGRQLAHQLRAAQERPAGDHPDPPRARRAARRHPRTPPTA